MDIAEDAVKESKTNKNIKNILGKPLIAWSIEQALSVKEIDKVVVSTDSPLIAKISNN